MAKKQRWLLPGFLQGIYTCIFDKEIPASASQTFNCVRMCDVRQDFKIFWNLNGRLNTWKLNIAGSVADVTTGELSARHSVNMAFI